MASTIDIGTAVAYLDLDTSNFEKGINKAQSSLETFSSVSTSIGQSVTAFGDSVTQVGQSMTKSFTLPIVGAFTAAVKTAADFDSAMAEVKSVTRSLWDDQDVTGEKFQELRDYALEWGGKTKFTTEEVANALNYMGMAGWEADQMIGGLPGILNLAAAGNVDLARTSDIVTDALTAFGEEADQATRFADVLATTAANSNTDVEMLGETFKYVAPIAGTLKYSLEDVALASGLMANSGVKATQAGTTLRRALSNMTEPTEAMQGAMVQLGLATAETATVMDQGKIDSAASKVAQRTIDMEKAQIKYNEAVEKYGESSNEAQTAALNLEKTNIQLDDAVRALTEAQEGSVEVTGFNNTLMYEADGTAKSFREVLIGLRTAFSGLSEEQQLSAAATIFGKNALSGMLAIINASEEDFNLLADAIDNSSGAAEKMAAILMDNLKGDFLVFTSQLSIAATRISDLLEPALRSVVQTLTKAVEWFNNLTEAEQMTIIKIAAVIAAIGPMLTIFGKIISTGGGVITFFGKLVGSGSSVLGLFGSLTQSGGVLSGLFGGVSNVVKTLQDSMFKLLNPLEAVKVIFMAFGEGGGIIAAVIAAVAALVAGFVKAYQESESFRETVARLLEVIGNFGKLVLEVIKTIWNTLKPVWDSVVELFSQLLQTLLPPLVDLLGGLIDLFSSLWKILGPLLELVGELTSVLITLLTPVLDVIAVALGAIIEVVAFVAEGLAALIGVLGDLTQAFWDGAKGIIDGFVQGIRDGWQKVKDAVVGLADKVREWFMGVLGIHSPSTVFEEFGLNTDQGYVNGIEAGSSGVIDAVDNLGSNVRSTFQNHTNAMTDIAQDGALQIEQRTQQMHAELLREYQSGAISQEEVQRRSLEVQAQAMKDYQSLEKSSTQQTNADILSNAQQTNAELLSSTQKTYLQVETQLDKSYTAMGNSAKDYSSSVSDVFGDVGTSTKVMANSVEETSSTLWTPLTKETADAMSQNINQLNKFVQESDMIWKTYAATLKSVGSIIESFVSSAVASLDRLMVSMQRTSMEMQSMAASVRASMSSINASYSSYDGYHASGLDYVPFNGYIAQLHEGERVLTKEENRDYSNGNINNGGGDVFNFYNTQPDPYEYARQMKRAKRELAFG